MSDQTVLLPKWCTPRGIILAKGQLGPSHNSVYAFTHYLVHRLFGWELGQLVFIAKKGV